ncbi:MAG: hypothetical protein JOZ29_05220 [Deltaproteobacteria bacterium]|nr:hypothetical protein [Deltaproteobacteria bacterium]
MLFKGSRYQDVKTYTIAGPSGQTITVLGIRLIPSTPAGFLHMFTADERLDIVAYNYYRNPEKFWLIADANSEMDPEDLQIPGQQLKIPPDRT